MLSHAAVKLRMERAFALIMEAVVMKNARENALEERCAAAMERLAEAYERRASAKRRRASAEARRASAEARRASAKKRIAAVVGRKVAASERKAVAAERKVAVAEMLQAVDERRGQLQVVLVAAENRVAERATDMLATAVSCSEGLSGNLNE